MLEAHSHTASDEGRINLGNLKKLVVIVMVVKYAKLRP